MFSIFYYLCFLLLFFPVKHYVIIHFVLSTALLLNILISFSKDRKQIKGYLSNHILFMLLWFLWTLVSYFWSLDPWQWLLQSMVVFTAMTHAFYLRKCRENKQLLFYIFILANVLHNLISWTQILLLGNNIPESLFYNQNFLATYLLFSFIFIVFWETDRFQLNSPLKYSLLLSNFLLILFANSRGITAITFFILFVVMYLKIDFKEIRKLLAVLLLLVLIIGAFVLFFTGTSTAILTDSSTVIRLNLVQSGLIYLREQPLIGLGAGSIVYLIENFPILDTNQYTVLHNWWIGLLVTHGVIFFAIYVFRYLWNGYLMIKIALRTKNPRAQMIITFFTSMIIAVMIPDSLFHSLWFWIIMNMLWTEIEELKEKVLNIQSGWVEKLGVNLGSN